MKMDEDATSDGGGGFCLSRHAKAKPAAAAEGEKAAKKLKMEEASVMADVEEQIRTWTKEEPQRKVVDSKRMVEKPMAMEKVRRVLAISPKPLIVHSGDVNPASLASMKLCRFGVDKIREFQDNVRRDLDTKGYVLGWATDDEDGDEAMIE